MDQPLFRAISTGREVGLVSESARKEESDPMVVAHLTSQGFDVNIGRNDMPTSIYCITAGRQDAGGDGGGG